MLGYYATRGNKLSLTGCVSTLGRTRCSAVHHRFNQGNFMVIAAWFAGLGRLGFACDRLRCFGACCDRGAAWGFLRWRCQCCHGVAAGDRAAAGRCGRKCFQAIARTHNDFLLSRSSGLDSWRGNHHGCHRSRSCCQLWRGLVRPGFGTLPLNDQHKTHQQRDHPQTKGDRPSTRLGG